MRLYPIKTPEFIQRLYPDYLWRFSSQEKNIYLTFDDGPTPEVTDFVLEQLKLYNAKATFFCIGKNVKKNPELFSQISKEGHSVGNHTYNHLNGWKISGNTYLSNINVAQKEIGNQERKLFRPPYGKIRKSQARVLQNKGYQIVMWDVLSGDWDAKLSKENCLQNILGKTTKGSIVVFHDSKKAEKKLKYVLPKVLKHFSKKGYSFKEIN